MNGLTCPGCGGQRLEPGRLNAKGLGGLVFTPEDASRWQRWFVQGVEFRATVCLDCGGIQLSADPDEIARVADGGETRCRKCRHILRGLSEPRCPECGEPI